MQSDQIFLIISTGQDSNITGNLESNSVGNAEDLTLLL